MTITPAELDQSYRESIGTPTPSDPAILKVGDVVYLKSGSPKLTITQQLENGVMAVAWMVYQAGTLSRADFPADALTKSIYTETK